jgi:hypothetical protein
MLVEYLWLSRSNAHLSEEKLMKSLHSTSTKMLADFTDRIGPLGYPAGAAS